MPNRFSPKNRRLGLVIVLTIAVLLLTAGVFRYRLDLADAWRQWRVSRISAPVAASSPIDVPAAVPDVPASVPVAVTPPAPVSEPPSPDRVNLPVPMVYQAPFGAWDARDEDACEEASMLMLQGFIDGRKSFERTEMADGLAGLVDYEMVDPRAI